MQMQLILGAEIKRICSNSASNESELESSTNECGLEPGISQSGRGWEWGPGAEGGERQGPEKLLWEQQRKFGEELKQNGKAPKVKFWIGFGSGVFF